MRELSLAPWAFFLCHFFRFLFVRLASPGKKQALLSGRSKCNSPKEASVTLREEQLSLPRRSNCHSSGRARFTPRERQVSLAWRILCFSASAALVPLGEQHSFFSFLLFSRGYRSRSIGITIVAIGITNYIEAHLALSLSLLGFVHRENNVN